MDKVNLGDELSGISVNSFYIPSNKSENYSNIIQILKTDLFSIQEMINSIGEIPMNQLKSKNPKLFEIEETRNINGFIDKIIEQSSNTEKIYDIYGTENPNDCIQKLYLECSLYDLLIKKLCDYFTLLKLKYHYDDEYQDSLIKIIKEFINNIPEKELNNNDTNSKISNNDEISKIKEKYENEIIDLKEKLRKESINNRENNNNEINENTINNFLLGNNEKYKSLHEILSKGKLTYLSALDNNNEPHKGILSFSRQTEDQTGIFAINLKDCETNFKLDFSNLFGFQNDDSKSEKTNFNTICYIEDWITDSRGDFYFLKEIINEHVTRKIPPCSLICFGFSIVPFNDENYKNTMDKSNARMITEIRINPQNYLDSFQVSIQLKEILEKKMSIEEFAKWYYYILNLLSKYNVTFYDYIKRLEFIQLNDSLSNLFFNYCISIYHMKNDLENTLNYKIIEEAENILRGNELGPICVITPEIGRWSTVGGLGVMVDELSQGLCSLGQDIIMISPYYDKNRKGEHDYLSKDPFDIQYIRNINVKLDGSYSFGVHYGVGNGGIKYYFLHNYSIFPYPYSEGFAPEIVRRISLFAKASLQLLCDLNIIPNLIVTNDWVTGLVPAYAKCGHFGNVFNDTTFFHICHNLEQAYEGRIYPSFAEGTLDYIHQLPIDLLVDPFWKDTVINPSRCAIIMCDQWGTISHCYKDDLMKNSPLAPLLNRKKDPFSFPNGIYKERRLKTLLSKAGDDRLECKRYIQKKYFQYEHPDLSVPLYSFIGRITHQKGVMLILESIEELIRRTNGRINILIGGSGNKEDPYVKQCIDKMEYLKKRYPRSFWCNPYEFFTDGPKINMGSDFGLIPSIYEPGGIVQHEFFIAGTPVIAFSTGGLKDTIIEYNYSTKKGNGFIFEDYTTVEFVNAVLRSLDLFGNKEHYQIIRKNASNSVIDVTDVCKAWCKEFYRLKGKVFFNNKGNLEDSSSFSMSVSSEEINEDKENTKKALEFLENVDEYFCNNYIFKKEDDVSLYDNQRNNNLNLPNLAPTSIVVDDSIRIPITFIFDGNYYQERINSVQVCGSFDNWQVRRPLNFDPVKNLWNVTLKIKKGKYFYKYIKDGEWVVNHKEDIFKEDNGIVNNVVVL